MAKTGLKSKAFWKHEHGLNALFYTADSHDKTEARSKHRYNLCPGVHIAPISVVNKTTTDFSPGWDASSRHGHCLFFVKVS